MSNEARRTKTVHTVIQELVEHGRTAFRPGDVTSALRERGQPMGTWEVRGEFSILEERGLISYDADTGQWSVAKKARRKAAG